MPQTFCHSARYPNLLLLKVGSCPRFGDVYLTVNTSNNSPILQYFDSPDFDINVYSVMKEVSDLQTCDWIFKACKWYIPYLGHHEWTAMFISSLTFLDSLVSSSNLLPRPEMIRKLKTYIEKDPTGTYLPLTHAKLELLLEEEAMTRLKERKARRIQNHWRSVVVNPYHIVCQRRLMRELNELCDG